MPDQQPRVSASLDIANGGRHISEAEPISAAVLRYHALALATANADPCPQYGRYPGLEKSITPFQECQLLRQSSLWQYRPHDDDE